MEKVPFNICEALLRGKDMRIVTTSFTGLPGKQRYVTTVTKKDDEEIYSLRNMRQYPDRQKSITS